MTSSIPTSVIPIINPVVPIQPTGTLTHKSVKLDYSSSLGFQASILSHSNSLNSLVSAVVETKFNEGSLKDKLSGMRQEERETYFLRKFNVEVERSIKGGFKVILSSKESSSSSSSSSSSLSFRTANELAETLKGMDLQDSRYLTLQNLALGVVEAFAQTQIKTKPLIEEVTGLAFANNVVITKSLLKVLVREINRGELLDVDLLKALKTTLINSWIDALDPDDLIQVLKITMQRMTQIHQQDQTSYKLYATLATISDILDVMGDSNVIGVGRLDLHDPLYKILDTLSDDDDPLIAAQAAYAKQALVRVPNDESKFRSFFRHGKALAQGFASLYKVISDKDLSSLLTAYDNFKEAFDFQQKKKHWYADVRILKLLAEKNLLKTFTNVIEMQIKETANPHIVGNILFILNDIIHHHSDLSAKKWALDLMADLFLNDTRWGDKKKVKKNILAQLLACASLPDQATSIYAKDVLVGLESKAKTKQHLSLIGADLPDDISTIVPKKAHHVEETSTTLITFAQRSQYLSLDQKIEQLKDSTLKDEDILRELASYIPVLGSRSLFDPKEQTFDLEKAVGDFLRGEKKVFLLLGDSGAGKSTFLRYIENRLWQGWNSKKMIPLFMSLPSLKSPFQEAISETLKAKGFTEQEQKELKANYSFLFLFDGYDELKLRQNLYISNQLHQWKGQMIITCRTQYLLGEQASYRNYFLPKRDSLISTPLMDEAAVSPFTPKQIEAYCRKFIKLHDISRTWEQYKSDLAMIPDLKEVIESPFVLRIIVEVLPELIQEHQHKKRDEQIRVLRIDIFDAFVKNWFDREELRVIRAGTWNENSDIKKAFAIFSTKLAGEMIEEGVVAIDYEDQYDPFHPKTSRWSSYFSSEPRLTTIRSGVPIRKIGPNTYAFTHKSLLEYFGARSILPQEGALRLQQKKVSSFYESKQDLLTSYSRNDNPNEIDFKVSSSLSTSSTTSKTTSIPIPSLPHLEIRSIALPAIVQSSKVAIPFSFDNLNKKLLTKEPEVVHLLAECLKKDPSLTPYLFDFIELSKTDPHAYIAAANAITILNAAGVNLSLRNFKGVRIPGANLSHSIITSTNFSQADLREVQFNESILDYSTFASSNVEGIEFGQMPIMHVAVSDITKVAISPNRKALFVGSEDGAIRIYEFSSGKEQACFIGHKEALSKILFSEDSSFALTAIFGNQKENTIKLWDCKNGQLLHSFEYESGVSAIAVSPCGKRVLSAGHDLTIRYWDSDQGKEIYGLKGFTKEVNSLAISPDGKKALAGNKAGEVLLWHCESGNSIHSFEGHSNIVTCVAFSPDGKRALTAAFDHTVRVWDCETGQEVISFKHESAHVFDASFSPDGKFVLSKAGGRETCLWNSKTGQKQFSFQGFLHSFSAEGNWLALGKSNEIQLLDCESGKVRLHFQALDLREIFFSSDGKWLNAMNGDGIIRMMSVNMTPSSYLTKDRLKDPIDSMEVVPNSPWVLLMRNENTDLCAVPRAVVLLNSLTGEMNKIYECMEENIWSYNCILHPNQALAVFKYEKLYCLINFKTGRVEHTFEPGIGYPLSFSADGNHFLTRGDKELILYDFITKKELKRYGVANNSLVAFSPEGKRLFINIQPKTNLALPLKILDCKTGEEIASFQKDDPGIPNGISPDGRWILSWTSDRNIRLWDSVTEKGGHIFKGHDLELDTIRFSPDCTRIVANFVGTDQKSEITCLWDCLSGKELPISKEKTEDLEVIDSDFGGYEVSFSLDSKYLLAKYIEVLNVRYPKEGLRNKVILYDLSTWEKQFEKIVRCFHFSFDSKWILLAGYDGIVRLWDCERSRELVCIRQSFPILCIKFLSDNKHILLSNNQPSLQLWRIFDDENNLKPALIWSKSSPTLSAESLNLQGVTGLSKSNLKLLQQHGAKVDKEEKDSS